MALELTARRQLAEATPLYRTAPHNIELEQALLGAILVNNEAFYRVSDFLEPRHFFEPIHQKVYEVAASLVRVGKTATPITLKTFLPPDIDVAGLTVSQYLARLAAEATTVINAADYGRTIYDLALRRALITIGEDVVNTAYDSPVDSRPQDQIEAAERNLYELAETGRYDGGFQRFAQALTTAVEMAAHAYQRDGKLSGARDRAQGPRPHDGRAATLRPRHPGRAPRHGQDGARHQHRLQHRQGMGGGGAPGRPHRVGQWRHRRVLFAGNVGAAARHPHHFRADRNPLPPHHARRDRPRRFRPHRRDGAGNGADPALYRRDRRPFHRPDGGARAPPQAATRPRPPGGRLHPAPAGIVAARPGGARPGGDGDHHQPQGAGEGAQHPDPGAVRSCRAKSRIARTSVPSSRTCANPDRSSRTPTS